MGNNLVVYVKRQWIVGPVISCIVISALAFYWHWNLQIASWFYQLEGGQWLLRDHFVTQTLFHKGARLLNDAAVILLLCITVAVSVQYRGRWISRQFLFLLASVLVSFGLVAYLKSVTNMDCPWDINLFGGSKPYYGLLDFKPSSIKLGKCYPAGHASVGYAWLALFFFFYPINKSAARMSLIGALILGVMLGIAQQLRGAHFFTDDVATALICWLVPACLFGLGAKQRDKEFE
ncbi:phosphatase PAP2 family protein [Neptunicella marina]|uniref:Phosphatase PAP2 family protein n=1 Tax=Neptunicella marina TaxID=2125989 RepID=A0A8J6M3K0_9ALTE|nr:phosphatase PAP2 family protein [Neptunicella marina]MBC3767558.1 phosphatase PAP2 family protein [Neptunicella marina]